MVCDESDRDTGNAMSLGPVIAKSPAATFVHAAAKLFCQEVQQRGPPKANCQADITFTVERFGHDH